MPRPAARSSGFIGKLFFVAMLAVVGGFFWAMKESGTTFSGLLAAFKGGAADTPVVDADPAGVPPKDRPKPPDPVRPDPPPVDPKPKDPPKETARTYTESDLTALFTEVRSHLRFGRLRDARNLMAKRNRLLVPPARMTEFRDLADLADRSWKLLLETTPGTLLDLPVVSQILVKGGGTRGIYVKNVVEVGPDIRFETLDGIRSRQSKSQVTVERLDPGRAKAAIDLELERRAGYKGIVVTLGPDLKLAVKPGRPVDGFAFFEVADFCARNGMNHRLVPLFEEAWKLDPNILETVRENRADALINVLIYFITIRAKDDAKWTLSLLNSRYRGTRAFHDKVDSDDDLKRTYEALFEEAIVIAPKPPVKPDPGSEAPAVEPEPVPEPPRPEPPPLEGSDPKPPDQTDTVLPSDAPAKARELVRQGDAAYKRAMEHLLNSDPNVNPTGWSDENMKALDEFTKAFEAYGRAQDLFGSTVPDSLLKRFRDTQMSRSLCRKRAVSKK